MSKEVSILVEKSSPVRGKITVSGAKNAALPLIVSALCTPGKVLLRRVPQLFDVLNLVGLLNEIGIKAQFTAKNDLFIDNDQGIAYADLTGSRFFGTIRYSILLLYPLLKKYPKIRVPHPGGCRIERSLTCHLKPLELMGYIVRHTKEYIEIEQKGKIEPVHFRLDPAHDDLVGMTESILLAALNVKGTTTIDTFAHEPEVYDMIAFLQQVGVDITVTDNRLEITPPSAYEAYTEYSIIPDRIETCSYIAMLLAALPESELILDQIDTGMIAEPLDIFRKINLDIEEDCTTLRIRNHNKRFKPVDVTARNYPGFPTDLQPVLAAGLCYVNGCSSIIDEVFPTRFKYARELKKAGARITYQKIRTNGKRHIKVYYHGGSPHHACGLHCWDLRSGMANVVMALGIQDTVRIDTAIEVFRGYEDLIPKLTSVGVVASSNYSPCCDGLFPGSGRKTA